MTRSIILLVVFLCPICIALDGNNAIGGEYRYGHIYYTSTGNIVKFVLEVAFRRKIETAMFKGTAVDGFAQTGDIVTLFGTEDPEFNFGDSVIARSLKMKVTAYSVEEDWILGEVHLNHEYSGPTNSGLSWPVQFSGCCRLAGLQNNQNSPYLLTLQINLNNAPQSPRAVILPVVREWSSNHISPPAPLISRVASRGCAGLSVLLCLHRGLCPRVPHLLQQPTHAQVPDGRMFPLLVLFPVQHTESITFSQLMKC
mmetsp:Transcript_22747/g.61858  ORF Transcript_22747/g.61858 Transcript_22747/m.61858 type:complete len:255 (+) Transcript_22747:119-883(+)